MIDPVTGSLILAGAGALGSAFTGANNAKMTRQQIEAQRQAQQQGLGQNYQQMGLQDRQFGQTSNMNRQQQLDQRMASASGVQEQLNRNPLRDRAMYMMQQRIGMVPGAVQPRDFTRGTMPGAGEASGGYAPVLNQMQTAAGQYRAGMGGMDPSAMQAQLAGLRDQSQMPGLYEATTPDAMRYGAERQQLQLDAANAKYAKDRLALQDRANRLAGTLGGGQAAPQLATAADRTQADRDAQKAAAKKRMMMIAGLGAAPFMPAALGALGGLMKGKAALGAIPTFASGFTDS